MARRGGIGEIGGGACLSYALQAINIAVTLFYTPILIAKLGDAEYGLFSLIFAVVTYLSVFDFGFGNAIVRYTAMYGAENDRLGQYELYGMFFKVYSFICLLAVMLGTGLYCCFGSIFRSLTPGEVELGKKLVLFMIANLVITFVGSVFVSIVNAHKRFVFQKSTNLLRVILQPCIMIPLLYLGCRSVALISCITILNLLYMAANAVFCWKVLKIKIVFRRGQFGLLREIVRYSFLVFCGVVIDKLNWYSGSFILGMLVSSSAVAHYAIVIQLILGYAGCAITISSLYLPQVTEMITRRCPASELSRVFIRVGRIQYIISGAVLWGFILFGRRFLQIWLKSSEYGDVYIAVVTIMIAVTVPWSQHIGVIILQGSNRQLFRTVLLACMSVLMVTAAALLAPRFGIFGCAAALGGSLLIGNVLILNVYYASRIKLDILGFWRQIAKLTLPMLAVAGVCFGLKQLLDDSLGLYLAQLAVFAVLYSVALFAFGLTAEERRRAAALVLRRGGAAS